MGYTAQPKQQIYHRKHRFKRSAVYFIEIPSTYIHSRRYRFKSILNMPWCTIRIAIEACINGGRIKRRGFALCFSFRLSESFSWDLSCVQSLQKITKCLCFWTELCKTSFVCSFFRLVGFLVYSQCRIIEVFAQ